MPTRKMPARNRCRFGLAELAAAKVFDQIAGEIQHIGLGISVGVSLELRQHGTAEMLRSGGKITLSLSALSAPHPL